ncbi:hypothetical protein [Tahibacter amnicola]|uniref:Anti-sigma factor RsiW n=1 Tax=Tahibacter amnicola TaxID=2976241 RepID=A0ABY6BG54_9GAMM|nr:hypothetical protein [Tahibacter amnicola]UXI68497.1 hypothetical protein N4264_02255 [Tahibacter amnicola]
MRDHIQSLLPWYINGTLSDAERASVERYLSEHPEEQSALDFWRHVASEQRRTAANAPEDIALQKTLERIRRETAPAGKPARRAADTQSRWSWLRLDNWLRPAFAVALLVVAVQSTLLLQAPSRPPVLYRGAGPVASVADGARITADSAFLRIVFDPSATEGEIRVLVAGTGGWVVGGPGEGGEYYLAVARQRAIAAADELRTSRVVKDVTPVTAVPPPG